MANRIKELREARGMTQEGLADAVGTSFQQISRLENGTRRLTVEWMRRIAGALAVHPAALFSDTLPDAGQFAERAEDAAVLRFWHSLDDRDKEWLIALARQRGVEILSDQPKRRPA